MYSTIQFSISQIYTPFFMQDLCFLIIARVTKCIKLVRIHSKFPAACCSLLTSLQESREEWKQYSSSSKLGAHGPFTNTLVISKPTHLKSNTMHERQCHIRTVLILHAATTINVSPKIMKYT